MSQMPESGIRVRVDPTNPGQFFACCGLLELAVRLWEGAEGWFENGEFFITTRGTLSELLTALIVELPVEITSMKNGLTAKPLIAPLLLSLDGSTSTRITLDTWMTIRIEKHEVVITGNAPWNFWSGQQTTLRIWKALRAALQKQMEQLDDLCTDGQFDKLVPLSGRFGFDPIAAWNTLDAGFSPNVQKKKVASSPPVELLAAVGIQRFRPELSNDRKTFVYSTWGIPLSPPVAAATASGLLIFSPYTRFFGHVVIRGKYKALGFSKPLKGDIP